jgi:hypothetical protein
MVEPGDRDVQSADGIEALPNWHRQKKDGINTWMYSPIEEIRANVYSTGYPEDKFVFVKGKVEDTIPSEVPESIAILRIDTDWYESTYHQLVHLFPLLSPGGVLIIDDYGSWQGCREACDRYFKETNSAILLHRVDDTARIAIKLGP